MLESPTQNSLHLKVDFLYHAAEPIAHRNDLIERA
jgi:hypothetical protein